jgi:hypothetical protein
MEVVMPYKVRNATMLALLTMVLPGFAKVPRDSQAGGSALTGRWSIQVRAEGRVRLQLQSCEGRASVSSQLALQQFQGLTEAQLTSTAAVNFQLVREAGTFTLSGEFRERVGAGQWTFNVAPAFSTLLRQHNYEQPTNAELFALAASDVDGAYIVSLRSAGYDAISLNELAALKSNGVTAEYITSLGAAGYTKLTAAQLIALRTNGVDREFIEGLESRGQKHLTVQRLLGLRTNGF